VSAELDPLKLLEEVQAVQAHLAAVADGEVLTAMTAEPPDLAAFVASLSSAWHAGEIRPTFSIEAKPRYLRSPQRVSAQTMVSISAAPLRHPSPLPHPTPCQCPRPRRRDRSCYMPSVAMPVSRRCGQSGRSCSGVWTRFPTSTQCSSSKNSASSSLADLPTGSTKRSSDASIAGRQGKPVTPLGETHSHPLS
jgi:hypothetical protein